MSGDTVFARWSDRKRAAAAESLAAPEPTSPPLVEAQSAPEADETPPPDLPTIESLTADSDFTPFMQAGVPEDLKRLALRKLWRSNPVFANLDGMNDYDEDFSLLYKVGAVIQTSYQVGKGMPGLEPDEADPVETAEIPVRRDDAD
ncbi:MAG: DUF3306 domain-containing protein, partial [Pseudomonadota bacterium]